MKEINIEKAPFCPSARTELDNSIIYGAIGGTVTKPRVTYFKQPQPFTDKLLAKISPITPTEVFRIAAPCAASNCQHFDGKDCRLAQRIVEKLSVVVEELPPCPIRRDCRWWQQSGKVACIRCPQVITNNYNPSELMRELAEPASV
ncbi:MAG: hypothetical protein CLLPBCKN_006882 [Chroococcidiopsis cubana SAG 39.79]|uniref:Nitrogen fixation protein n=1 Tax=Chroococcidiopsis cubana SAG 39.79 TaxID=388085 RepID=A0AB37UIK4_9CYAN|nr:nitrogen fixation protein [Chroococcidiopsis cubana]MDZ4877447.1 hypothetical protein [Chroococcidiopsis cubana SAG 39.79]PSB65829.1 nitrogen fixation protein [Chroococcidiopsis cubana CCALA 043]RUT11215.1 hypothetical protein DSM107010_34840 [Chroococcidiopsis cubana SAG 39.79]